MHSYTVNEVTRMMRGAGLELVGVYGDARGAPFDPDTSPSMVILARKPISETTENPGQRRQIDAADA